jgi:hypothetical protein
MFDTARRFPRTLQSITFHAPFIHLFAYDPIITMPAHRHSVRAPTIFFFFFRMVLMVGMMMMWHVNCHPRCLSMHFRLLAPHLDLSLVGRSHLVVRPSFTVRLAYSQHYLNRIKRLFSFISKRLLS